MDTDPQNTPCASENCSREQYRGGYCKHCHAFQSCQVVIRSNYLPSDLSRLADKLEKGNIQEIKRWISSLGENKPLILLRVVCRIETICRTYQAEESVILRKLSGWCRNVPKFHAQVADYDKKNGGEGTYQRDCAKIIAESLAKGAMLQNKT